MNIVNTLSLNSSRKIKINFNGGDLLSAEKQLYFEKYSVKYIFEYKI